MTDYLIPSITDDDAESMTFYLKMKGDYHRYQAEVASAEEKAGECRITHALFICKQTKVYDACRIEFNQNFSRA